jgi:DNA-binding transcriptional MerR regulator
MKEIRMRMSEICNLIGISPQGIRLYEKYKAIPDLKWEGNGYRYYYFENIGPSIGLRGYRHLGIPLKETVRLCSGIEVGEIKDGLYKREKEIVEELKLKEALLKCTKEIVDSMDDIINNFNKFDYCERPAMYFLECEENGKILNSKEDRRLLKAWSSKFPIVKFCPLIEKENLSENTVSKVGFCVKEEYAKFVPEIDNPRVKYYPKERCIGGVTRVTRETMDYYSIAEQGLNYLKERELELAGDIFTLLIAPGVLTKEPEEVIADYHYIWFPVKSKQNDCYNFNLTPNHVCALKFK